MSGWASAMARGGRSGPLILWGPRPAVVDSSRKSPLPWCATEIPQVRRWDSWHRHITLALLAHAFLAELRRQSLGGSPAPGSGPRRSAGPPQRARGTPTPGSGLAAAGTVASGAPRLVDLASAPPG